MEEIIICPHCKEYIIIQEVNCGIFRHAIYKSGEQINPHLKKELCEQLIKEGKIFGCGKPFRLIVKDKMMAVECDYI